MVVIEDADGPTSLAGVMGGARSEVSDSTTTVLSEVATWNGPNIHDTGLKLGLRSEALARYEKGLQPEQTLWAQAVATKLFIDVCGATVRPGTLDLGGPGPAPITIRLRDARSPGCSASRSRASAPGSCLRRSGSRPSRPPTGSTSPSPTSAAPTSPARPT